jgi:hypothetical protein
MRDSRGQAQFIGESSIPHTPGGSALALKTGDAFDVKVQPVLVKRSEISLGEWQAAGRWRITRSDGTVWTETYEYQKTYFRSEMRYTITNAKSVPVTVDIIQGGLGRWWWWHDVRVPEESIKGKQLNNDERIWEVTVPANGSVDLTATFLTPW